MLDDIEGSLKVRETAPLSLAIGKDEAPKVDSGASSIEKSKAVRAEVVPPINIPVLIAPSDMHSMAFAVASIDAMGKPVMETIHSFVLQGEEIKHSVLEAWLKNLRDIEEQVRQMLSSPLYQQLQEIRQKGDSTLDPLSQIEGVSSESHPIKGQQVELLSTLDRLQVLERVPFSAKVGDVSASQDTSQVLLLPLTAALLAGGALAGGADIIHATSPLGNIVDAVKSLQSIFPTVSVQDLIPLINLMVVGPIYFHSWNEAVSNLRSRDRHSHVPMIQNFAKDVIKIVTDPSFISKTLIQRMKGTENLSPQDQDRLGRMLKVVLIGVALSLLYSGEVGKVQNGQFGGIEPEEVRDLLLGKWSDCPDPTKKATLQEQLTATLIRRAWQQLEPLSIEDRTAAVDLLLSYITQHRELDPMLDPAKVFDETVSAILFNPKDKVGIVKA